MAATSPSCSPTSSSYVAILVGHDTDGALTALETIHEVGSTSHITEAATSAQDASAASAVAAIGEDDDHEEHEHLQQQQQQRTATGREIAFRVSTPDRIRRRSELLYNEVHAMMERHDSRTGRERDIQRRDSRNSRVAAAGLAGRDAGRRGDASPSRVLTVSPSTAPPLPDLYNMFEESRRARLTEAQQHRTYFPSSSKPTTYSSKDPSTFSYRFLSFDAGSSSQ